MDDAQHRAPFWYYLPVIIAGSLPWLGLLPEHCTQAGKPQAFRNRLFVELDDNAAAVFLRRQRQIAHLYSFLLCTSGNADGALRFAGSKNNPLALRINGWINIAFGVTGIIATFVVSHGDQ